MQEIWLPKKAAGAPALSAKRATPQGKYARPLIGIGFLAIQLAQVFHAQWGASRWLCWAPNDYVTEYRLEASVEGRQLSPQEIADRYQIPARGVYENPAQNIIEIVEQYEETYGRTNPAKVTLLYRVSGGTAREWQWPAKRAGPEGRS